MRRRATLVLFAGLVGVGCNASAAAQQSSAAAALVASPSTVCSGQHWPVRLPRDLVGKTLAEVSVGELLCFNLVNAQAQNDRHNVLADPADAASGWIIVASRPAPGTAVGAGTPISLVVRRAD
jgi:hypothetical protein